MESVIGVLLVVGIPVAILSSTFWFLHCVIDQERYPWQHAKRCPCGKCFARRMKQAVERAEYERQQDEIREAVRDVNRR